MTTEDSTPANVRPLITRANELPVAGLRPQVDPRLAKGIVWADILAEIEHDQALREAGQIPGQEAA